jgi:ribosomal protein S18 acetylase RimI-like enzyme
VSGLPAVRALEADERAAAAARLAEAWGSSQIVSRGRLHDAASAPALGCFESGQLVGLATFELAGGELQVLTLNAFEPGQGIGSLLLEALIDQARAAGCRRLWLVTSNDNLEALRFYQRRGLRLVAVHAGAIELARKLKPAIPRVGAHGIEIRDELELELRLDAGA